MPLARAWVRFFFINLTLSRDLILSVYIFLQTVLLNREVILGQENLGICYYMVYVIAKRAVCHVHGQMCPFFLHKLDSLKRFMVYAISTTPYMVHGVCYS